MTSFCRPERRDLYDIRHISHVYHIRQISLCNVRLQSEGSAYMSHHLPSLAYANSTRFFVLWNAFHILPFLIDACIASCLRQPMPLSHAPRLLRCDDTSVHSAQVGSILQVCIHFVLSCIALQSSYSSSSVQKASCSLRVSAASIEFSGGCRRRWSSIHCALASI